jgi:hypothetical protein
VITEVAAAALAVGIGISATIIVDMIAVVVKRERKRFDKDFRRFFMRRKLNIIIYIKVMNTEFYCIINVKSLQLILAVFC